MASLVVLMDVNASCSHDTWNIVFTNESVSCFEATSTTESVHNIIHTKDHITKDAVLWTNVEVTQSVNVDWLLWAENTIVDINALPKEQFVKVINIIADTKHTFVVPEVIKVITAYPLSHILVFIIKMNLEA